MKKLVPIFMTLAVLPAMVFAFASGSASSVAKLWDEYEKAARADLPQTRLEILDKIISLAQKDRLVWDFYTAWNRKVDVTVSRDWKQRSEVVSARGNAFKAFDEPIINFLSSGGYTMDALSRQRAVLEKKCNERFYGEDKFLSNDWQFLLWNKLMSYNVEDRNALLEALKEQFGSVMDLYTGQDAFTGEFERLDRENASEQQYKALRDRIEEFEKKRLAFKGRDAQIAAYFRNAEYLAQSMDRPELSLSADEDNVTVVFRNLRRTVVSLATEESPDVKIFSSKLENARNRYYVRDTVTLGLPVLNDGNYIARAESSGVNVKGYDDDKVETSCNISRHFISAALVRDADGLKLYAAEYASGKPISSCDVTVYDSKSKVVASCSALKLKGGFTLLPSDVAAKLDNDSGKRQYNYAVCSFADPKGVKRLSCSVYPPYALQNYQVSSGDNMRGLVFTDCGAYHRGDTVCFKTVLYSGDYFDRMACARKGEALSVDFIDPDNRTIATRSLTTGEYGAADGFFEIPSGCKGGIFRIRVMHGKLNAATSSVRVDDFVLPDFDCQFEKIEGLYFAGDTVSVKGCVKAYSGHRINAAGAYCEVTGLSGRMDVKIASDGSFSIPVPTPKNRYWGTSVKLVVSSATGQTLEFVKNIPLSTSLDFSARLLDRVEASVDRSSGKGGGPHPVYEDDTFSDAAVVSADKVRFDLTARNSDGVTQNMQVKYVLRKGGKDIEAGAVHTPCELALDLPGPSGEYIVEFTATVRRTNHDTGKKEDMERVERISLIKAAPGSTVLDADVENIFIPYDKAEDISFAFGAARGPVWAVATLYGKGGRVLWTDMLQPCGVRGAEGSMMTVSLSRALASGQTCTVSVMYFRNGKYYCWTHEYDAAVLDENMVISWNRFTDTAAPGSRITMTLSTNYPSETIVSVFDKSTETIASNFWYAPQRYAERVMIPEVSNVCGGMSSYNVYGLRLLSKAAGGPVLMAANSAMADAEGVVYDSVMTEEAASVPQNGEEPRVRENFATTICWEPCLHTDGKTGTSFSFTASDKTGTFVVSAFSFDRKMHSAVLRKEMKVTLPVMVTMAPPTVLHEGDRPVIKATVSSLDAAVCGTVILDAAQAGRWSRSLSLEAGEVAALEFPLTVPQGMSELPLTLSFTAGQGGFSDAVAMKVPVKAARQTLTESHSAVCLAGADKQALVDSLRGCFVNVSSFGAQYSEISIEQMLRSVIEQRRPSTDTVHLNSVELSEDVCVNMLYNRTAGGDVAIGPFVERLMALRNADGGFSWFRDMDSSPSVTAVILQRNAIMKRLCGKAFLDAETVAKAAGYLDASMFSSRYGYARYCWWCPGISLQQYLYVRSFYPSVKFTAAKDVDRKEFKAFSKAVKDFLLPGSSRGLVGQVWEKTLRLATLRNLSELSDGQTLMKSWKASCCRRTLARSLEADVKSLCQYARRHSGGGWYYPNLVMPYRGLLSSEAWYHSVLCDVMQPWRPDISDGVRLWLMLQKETQKWDSSFAFAGTVAVVLEGSSELLATRVLTMSRSFEKPLQDILAAGNGFSVKRSFRVTAPDGTVSDLADGAALHAGDKITAVYSIFNAENRSFVRLKVPRYGCLRPVNQLSGRLGWFLRPLSTPWGWTLSPQGYREVRHDGTEYWFESYPEQESSVTEEYFVEHEGTFRSGVVEIESLYAPHYRANAAYEGTLDSKK